MAEKSVRGLDLHVVTKMVPVRLREELKYGPSNSTRCDGRPMLSALKYCQRF